MNSFIGLCRREWLEHRGGFLWAPASVAAVIVVAVVLVLIVGQLDMARVDLDLDLSEAAGSDVEVRIDGEDTSILDLVNVWLTTQEWTDEELSAHLSGLLRGVAEPFHYVYFIVLVFVLLGALHDDRKDRTVLFWKIDAGDGRRDGAEQTGHRRLGGPRRHHRHDSSLCRSFCLRSSAAWPPPGRP